MCVFKVSIKKQGHEEGHRWHWQSVEGRCLNSTCVPVTTPSLASVYDRNRGLEVLLLMSFEVITSITGSTNSLQVWFFFFPVAFAFSNISSCFPTNCTDEIPLTWTGNYSKCTCSGKKCFWGKQWLCFEWWSSLGFGAAHDEAGVGPSVWPGWPRDRG